MRLTDGMLGRYNPDGSIAEWPALAVNGRRFDRAAGGFSLRPIMGNLFAVVTGATPADIELEVADASPDLETAFRQMFPEPLEDGGDDE